MLEFRKAMYDESVALIEKKGHDYSGSKAQEDTLRNLRLSTFMGVTETDAQGILVRICDKIMRMASLSRPGVDPAVSGESLRDTVRDLHNYADYFLLVHEQAAPIQIVYTKDGSATAAREAMFRRTARSENTGETK